MERSVPEAVFRFQKVARQVGQKHFAATVLAVSSHVPFIIGTGVWKSKTFSNGISDFRKGI